MTPLNWTLEDWCHASPGDRREWAEDVADQLGSRFRLTSFGSAADATRAPLMPGFVHIQTGTEWVLIPRCSFLMGLSEGEERAARALQDPPPLNIEEMRPVHSVHIQPFLVMCNPLTWEQAQRVVRLRDAAERPFFDLGPSGPAYMTRGEVEEIASTLGLLLPTEAQWECACRGGTRTLFFFGDALPRVKSELAALVDGDLIRSRPNPFGLRGLFIGEWCRDRFRASYEATSASDDFAVRGGGSAFWPWQDAEWAFCMSAMRMPSRDLSNGMAGARLVLELGSTQEHLRHKR